MLEDLEEGDILHFKNGITKVKKVELEKVKFGRETRMKITAHFPNDSDNSKCDLDFWFYEKNGELCGGVCSFLNIIKVEKSQKQNQEFDASRPGFYKTKDGRIAEFLRKTDNGRSDNLYFILMKEDGFGGIATYTSNGKWIQNEHNNMDLVEYLGTELPNPKIEPRKYEFETKVIRIGKHMRFDDEPYFYVVECPKELWTKKFKVTMEDILE